MACEETKKTLVIVGQRSKSQHHNKFDRAAGRRKIPKHEIQTMQKKLDLLILGGVCNTVNMQE